MFLGHTVKKILQLSSFKRKEEKYREEATNRLSKPKKKRSFFFFFIIRKVSKERERGGGGRPVYIQSSVATEQNMPDVWLLFFLTPCMPCTNGKLSSPGLPRLSSMQQQRLFSGLFFAIWQHCLRVLLVSFSDNIGDPSRANSMMVLLFFYHPPLHLFLFCSIFLLVKVFFFFWETEKVGRQHVWLPTG